MIFPVRHIIAYISAIMNLEPGDLIATGISSSHLKARLYDEVKSLNPHARRSTGQT
jgi:2-keto-4-pentenoate hydratase/2-oxohepta-3-ene-1,7-dioic acid hydratase in catechol pathway